MWLIDLRRWCCLTGEDLGELLEVGLDDRARLPRLDGLLQPILELGLQDVDLAVQDPAAVGDLVLLLLQVLDQLLELVVGQRSEIGQRFHSILSSMASPGIQARAARKGQPTLETRAFAPRRQDPARGRPRRGCASRRRALPSPPRSPLRRTRARAARPGRAVPAPSRRGRAP